MSVKITEKAAKEIKKVMEEQSLELGNDMLRVGVSGGGCSGFSYGLSFCKKEEVDALSDVTYEEHGIEWVVDSKSAQLMEGTVVDFQDEINGRGFTFNNPQATKSCGCGSSFGV